MKARFRILDKTGRIISSTILPEEMPKLSQVTKESQLLTKSLRCGVIKNNSGTVYGFSDHPDCINSSRTFLSSLHGVAISIESIDELCASNREQVNTNTNRLLHNLISLNGHNIQEIFSLVDQNLLSSSQPKEQILLIEKEIQKNIRGTANSFLRIIKNNAGMKTEFSVFNKLFTENPRLSKQTHNVHKVLMNILYPFFPEFTDKHIEIKVSCPKNTLAFFDYESIHVAFFHLIENSVKYVKPNTDINIDISTVGNFVEITFKMVSVAISKDEVSKIFQEGFSGKIPLKINKAGNGIGLYRARSILELNDGSISIEPNIDSEYTYIGIPYQENIFKIKLKAAD